MKKALLFFSLFLFTAPLVFAQMWNGQDTLYGNEWIKYDQNYLKISVAEDAIYRLTHDELQAQGIPVAMLSGNQYQLFHMGQEVPVYTSTNGPLGNDDYIEFWGIKNRSELDRYLFQNPEEQLLNSKYSLFTDTSAYFLTWVEPNVPTARYTVQNNDLSNYSNPLDWCWAEEELVFSNKFMKYFEVVSGVSASYSNFDMAEGFCNQDRTFFLSNGNTIQNHTIAYDQLAATGPSAQVTTRFAVGEGGHHQMIKANGVTYYDEVFEGFVVKEASFEVPTASMEGEAELSIDFEGVATQKDKQGIAFISLRYPRQFNFENQGAALFELPASSSIQYIAVSAFEASNGNVILYDQTNQIRLEGQNQAGEWRFALPPSAQTRKIALINDNNGSQAASKIEASTFVNYAEEDASFIIISHPALFDDGNGNNYVQEYADYRSSADGGNFNSLVVDIQQLYDQFAYGLNRHSISIRNFGHYIKKNWTNPEYVFIIGKGREYTAIRTDGNLANAANQTFFVPAFGAPATDNLLLSNNTSSIPVLAIGRIATTSPQEIKIYLDKIKAFDETGRNQPQTIEGRSWIKNIVHLGGGGNTNERALIEGYLNAMEQRTDENRFGGNVTSFFKKTTDPVESSLTQGIFDRINEGSSLITFFGHSSPGRFNFNIDNPENYNNYGKYPLLLSLGCYSGNIFTSNQGVSEQFTFLENKATIAFGATRGIGFISTLGAFGIRFYENMGDVMYGESIGKILYATLATYDNNNSLPVRSLVQQFTLHGDPAVRLHSSQGPDFTIDPATARFGKKTAIVQDDSLDITFDIVNLGIKVTDSLSFEISQKLPNGDQVVVMESKLKSPGYQETYTFKLPIQGKEAIGQNSYYIKLDPNNDIDELPNPEAEFNNELIRPNGERGISIFILDNSATPIFPSEFSIVGDASIALKASTTDANAPIQKYIFELDTTSLFNSPSKVKAELVEKGGLINWAPEVSFRDSTVYYWRISPDSTNAEVGFNWAASSFTYINNSPPGWRQGHFNQFEENTITNLNFDNENQKINFVSNFTDFLIKNRIPDGANNPNGFVNGARWSDFFRWEVNQSINIVVVDSIGRFVFNIAPGQYGSLNQTIPDGLGIACFSFPVETTEQRSNIINFIEGIVPENYMVFIYTATRNETVDLNVQEWAADSLSLDGKNLFNLFEQYGATQIRKLEEGVFPYLFHFKKESGVIGEELTSSKAGEINYEFPLEGFWSEGSYTTPLIGPAKNWESFSWKVEEATDVDTIQVSIWGVQENGQNFMLVDSITTPSMLLDTINVQQFPYLQLQFNVRDEVSNSAAQLDFWQIKFEGIPDAAVAPNQFLSVSNDTIAKGEVFDFACAIENTSFYDMDSLLVKYTLTDNQNREQIKYQRLAPLASGDTLIAQTSFDTKDLGGTQSLLFEINPNKDQEEQNEFNNFFLINFDISQDEINPLIDVTFDGIHILDGDLVSSKPTVAIALKDENQIFPFTISDTSLFDFFIFYPSGQQQQITPNEVLDIQIDNSENRLTLIVQPELSEDGIYQLVVNGSDKQGNIAGAFDYSVSFEVINERRISNVLTYPNPFSTSTQFVYTLTGDEPPTNMKIQIMTVSGRIVKEIMQSELGELKIGTHRTEYTWDGTDDYGEKLANGVYLYRVVAKDDLGQNYKSHDNGTNQYFKKGIGKVVILR